MCMSYRNVGVIQYNMANCWIYSANSLSVKFVFPF